MQDPVAGLFKTGEIIKPLSREFYPLLMFCVKCSVNIWVPYLFDYKPSDFYTN